MLRELARGSDPYTRDAADLARVELLWAHGGSMDYRETLERLVQHGQTPLLRRRAAELLARVERAPR